MGEYPETNDASLNDPEHRRDLQSSKINDGPGNAPQTLTGKLNPRGDDSVRGTLLAGECLSQNIHSGDQHGC